MKKYLITSIAIMLGLIVITSTSKSQDEKKSNKKSKSTVIKMAYGDTTINGKSYSELTDKEKAELKELQSKIDEMHKEIDLKMKEYGFYEGKHSPKAPKAPRHPSAPRSLGKNESRVIVIPSPPELPNLPDFGSIMEAPMAFSFNDNGFEFSDFSKGQSYSFNDGDKHINLRLNDANSEDIKRLKGENTSEQKIKLQVDFDTNTIKLNFEFNKAGNLKIKLYDKDAKLIKTEEIKNYSGKKSEISYDLNDFEDGKYYIDFDLDGMSTIKKLYINR